MHIHARAQYNTSQSSNELFCIRTYVHEYLRVQVNICLPDESAVLPVMVLPVIRNDALFVVIAAPYGDLLSNHCSSTWCICR
jgi:hypothetical protein